jgi:hypothetical protein
LLHGGSRSLKHTISANQGVKEGRKKEEKKEKRTRKWEIFQSP